jgi:hypothetical protein
MLDIAFLNVLLRPCISQPTLEQALNVDFDGGVATCLATTFYLVIWQHNRGNVFMLFSCVK